MLAVSQKLQQPVAFSRLALDQFAAVAQQVTQLTEGLGRHKALCNEAVTDQIGNPFSVLHVRLAAWHIPDVASVAHNQLEGTFQNGIDRPPVDPRALHAHMRHPGRLQPIVQGLEIARHCLECAGLPPRRSARHTDQHTGNHARLMHIQARTSLDYRLHPRPPLVSGRP